MLYVSTGSPPSFSPFIHENEIVVPDLRLIFSTMLLGASGTVRIIAPLTGSDTADLPYKLEALTLAKILDPKGKL
jgi:hypothetical protein